MTDHVCRSLIELINGTVFSVIADETTIESTVEQICVAGRFALLGGDWMTPQLQERFLCFGRVSFVTCKLKIHNIFIIIAASVEVAACIPNCFQDFLNKVNVKS